MSLNEWEAKGFATQPLRDVAFGDGLLIYRAWGAGSTELGTGYFSLEKPQSVLDAELRFNIVDWGNGVHFLSTFRIPAGVPYFVGPVAHGRFDLSRPGHQVYVESSYLPCIELLRSREVLRHDVSVVQRSGTA